MLPFVFSFIHSFCENVLLIMPMIVSMSVGLYISAFLLVLCLVSFCVKTWLQYRHNLLQFSKSIFNAEIDPLRFFYCFLYSVASPAYYVSEMWQKGCWLKDHLKSITVSEYKHDKCVRSPSSSSWLVVFSSSRSSCRHFSFLSYFLWLFL